MLEKGPHLQNKSAESTLDIVFFTTNKYTINITIVYIRRVSLYVIYTPTCFDISMSSSGSFTFVSCKVT